ncbi:hypothetical protein [Kribbella jiaozuonensis]|uniref:Uncharacterized protein n=1 Tax=Kribbella jiaozuonensis TaxID=2575441 RepID=A0A4U3LM76_9ACTN|nr:hypothetical protein [Kribbella jiaozuonensis]TKK76662.1 hypothetical protein FDA38_30385 [Kribbella jiaozuonensis]
MTDDNISQDRMRELLDSGAATPMLAGTEVGPTWYADRWWYVPVGAAEDADYQPADPEQAERFDSLRRRAEAVERVQAELDGRQ